MIIEIIEDGLDDYGGPRYRIRRARKFLFFKYYEYAYYPNILLGNSNLVYRNIEWIKPYQKMHKMAYTSSLQYAELLFDTILNPPIEETKIRVIKSNQPSINEKKMKVKLGV